jgi:hypothetical protein
MGKFFYFSPQMGCSSNKSITAETQLCRLTVHPFDGKSVKLAVSDKYVIKDGYWYFGQTFTINGNAFLPKESGGWHLHESFRYKTDDLRLRWIQEPTKLHVQLCKLIWDYGTNPAQLFLQPDGWPDLTVTFGFENLKESMEMMLLKSLASLLTCNERTWYIFTINVEQSRFLFAPADSWSKPPWSEGIFQFS